MHDIYTYDLMNKVMWWYYCENEWMWLILWLNAWCPRVYVKVICYDVYLLWKMLGESNPFGIGISKGIWK